MATETATNSKLAVLIDADNVTPSVAEALLAETAKYGTSFVRRAYGNWTRMDLRGWKEQLLTRSIQPIQQFSYTYGKNSTDSAMIIDAMDLLYTNRFDGFCLVSSDSDFTRLAARIRESGLVVYGFGERKTPKPFVAACDKFIYVEDLNIISHHALTAPHTSVNVASPAHNQTPSTAAKIDAKLELTLRRAVEASSDEEGWANLSDVGNLLSKWQSDIDPRTYGEVIIGTNAFEIDKRTPAEGGATVIYARDKNREQWGTKN
jgi:hypothetical protein